MLGAVVVDQIEQGHEPPPEGEMMIERACVAVCDGLPESVTWTLKLEVPAVLGVPLIAPVLGFKVKPAGSEPLEIDQVYGVAPPLAVTEAE
jgi:hypothetical protein